MEVLQGGRIIRQYRVGLGPGGLGPKGFEGDLTTPTGRYVLQGRWASVFHRFLHVSYPNAEDVRRFAERKARGEVPPGKTIGGDIGIHGGGSESDWTLGCIAVTDEQIDEIAALAKEGSEVVITD